MRGLVDFLKLILLHLTAILRCNEFALFCSVAHITEVC